MESDVINSIADTIHLLLDNLETSPEDDQVRILVQILPFFKELLTCLNSKNIEENPKVIKTSNECIKSYKQCIKQILNSDINFEELSMFINDIILSCVVPKCITAISQLIVSIISLENIPNETRNYFQAPIQSYFKNQELRYEFVKGEGFLTTLFSYISDQDNVLHQLVFDQFFEYLEYFKQSTFFPNIDAFYSTIFSNFVQFDEKKVKTILEFLTKSLQKNPNYVLKHLNKSSSIISEYVLQHQSEELYQNVFRFLNSNKSLSKNPIYSILIKIGSSNLCSKELRNRVLMDILQIISIEKKQVFSNSDISKMLSAIPSTDIESLLIAFSICLHLNLESEKMMSTPISQFMKNLKYDYFTQFDMNNLFSLFLSYPDQLSKYVELIYKTLLEQDSIESFTHLSSQYKSLFSLILKHFQMQLKDETKEKIIKSLVLSYPFYDNNTPKTTLYTILVKKGGHQFIKTVFECIEKLFQSGYGVTELFALLEQANYESEQLRAFCFENQIASIVISFYSKYEFDSTIILDFICSIAAHRYVPKFDIQISELLRNNNFLNKNQDELLKFALGLKQNQTDQEGNLCFPSILGFCKDHQFTDLFDLWICGESGLTPWLADTHRSIDEFPSIIDIACLHIRLVHIKMLFDYPSLLYQIATKLENVPPRWIFKKNSEATYPLNLPQNGNQKNICFWIRPSDDDIIEPTDLFSIGNNKLTFAKNEIRLDNRTIWHKFSKNYWTFCCITFTSNDTVSISFNLSNAVSFKTIDFSLIFGYIKGLNATWSIGGPIRIFNDNLANEKLTNIMNNGPCCSKTYGEAKYIVPLPIQIADFKYEVQPITIYSIANYIRNVYGNLEFLFKRIIDLLDQNNLEDAKFQLKTLICFAKKKIVDVEPQTFSHYISILFNISHDIIDNSILTDILTIYENDTFDWNGFLPLLFDYNFHCSHLSVSLISAVFHLVDKYPINDPQLTRSLILFFASLLSISEYKQELKGSILELIEYLKPDQNLCLNLIVSYPQLADNLMTVSKQYSICKNDYILSELINMYGRLQFTKFSQYHLFSILPKKESIQFQTILLKSKIDNLDTTKLLDNCFRCINYKESWLNYLYITTNKWQEFNSISLTEFDMSFIESLIQMLSVLVCSCFQSSIDEFWINLSKKLINELCKIVNLIPERYLKQPTFRFWFIQLMSIDESFLTQSFLSNEKFEIDMNDIEIDQKTDEVPKLLKNALSICPKEVLFEQNCIYQIDSTDYQNDSYSIYLANQISIGKTWFLYMQKKIQSFQSDENQSELSLQIDSPLFAPLIQLFTYFLLYSETVSDILINCVSYTRIEFYKEMIRQLLMNALSLSIELSVFKPEVIDLACVFIIQNKSFEMLKKVFDNLSYFHETPSSTVYLCIINLLTLTVEKEFVDLLIEYKQILLTPNFTQDSDIPKQYLGQFLCFLSSGDYLKDEKLFSFFKDFIDLMQHSELVSNEDIDLFKKFQSITSVDSFQVFKNENPDFLPIERLLIDYAIDKNLFFNVSIIEDIKAADQNRFNYMNEFFETSKSFIINQSLKKTFDRTTAAIELTIFQQIFVLRTLFFIRQKELFVSQIFKFHFNNSKDKNKCQSFLADPLYPTRRLIDSPLDYNIPEFPAGSVNEILSTALISASEKVINNFPHAISDIFTVDPKKAQFLEAYSNHQIHLRYVQILNVPSIQKLNIIQMLYNQGNTFSFISSCSILYGCDTLDGTIFLGDEKLIFIEGLNYVNKNEIAFSDNVNFDNQCFYSFIILSGQLGSPSLFEGHPVFSLAYDELLVFSQHNWLHKPFSFALNFLRGFNFVLNLQNQKDYHSIETIFNKKFSIMQVSSPIAQKVLSPIQSAAILSKTPKELANLWLQCEISNFTYLLLLNRLGKRLTCDMTQYPVFPWLLTSFKSEITDFDEILNDKSNLRDFSLPIGQLNLERSGKFDETFKMNRGEYFYGSHYMHLAVVLYYLYRIDPYSYLFFMFNQGWDHPSRMFFDVSKAWSTSLESPLDLKEIVPQFFCLPEMFEKSEHLFKEKDDNEVQLPQWAKNSRDFTNKMLLLLESENVSSKIHLWIDLIFGEKSRGTPAIQAKNLFPPHCYIDIKNENEVDEIQNEALKLKIINFGQCPTQLFTKPHLSSYKTITSTTVLNSSFWQNLRTDSFAMPPNQLFVEGNLAMSSRHPIYKSDILMNGMVFHIKNNNKIVVTRGNTTTEFELGFNDVIDFKYASSTIAVSPDGAFLCISRAEGIFAFYRIIYTKGGDVKSINLIHQFETKGGIGMIAISSFHQIAFASTGKAIVQYDLGTLEEIEEKISLPFSATKIFIDDIAALVYFIGDNNIAVCSISGKLLINQLTPMLNEDKRKLITCFAFPKLPEYSKSRFFVIGYEDGSIDFWQTAFNTDDNGQLVLLRTETFIKQPILSIALSSNAERMLVGTKTEIYHLEAADSSYQPFKKELYAISCANCGSDLHKTSIVCSKCGRFFCQKCVKKDTSTIKPSYICNKCSEKLELF